MDARRTSGTSRRGCWSGRAVPNLALLLAMAAGIGLLLSAGGAARAQQAKPAADEAATKPAGTAPAASAAAKSPKELVLAEFLRMMKLDGKPVLIEFGLVGCAVSEKGLDAMIALHKADTRPDLAFVRVEGNADAGAVARHFKAKAPPFPVYQDSGSVLAKALSATAYPTFLLVDKFGHVRYQGKYSQDDLVAWAKALAAETVDPGSNAPQFGAKELNVKELLAGKLPDLKGAVKPLGEYAGAGGLMLLFADTSCPFSAIALKEMPLVSKTVAEQKIGAVVVNSDDAKADVLAFYARNDAGTPVVYDTGATTRDRWNVHSVPIAVYITPDGKIAYQGEAVWANMGSAMDKALSLAPGTIKFTSAGTGFG